ncbi:diguanylate cyclase [Halomonas sp. 1513]|nr:EAL domain-containing protein [Halomonas sp. 1513]APX93915.1 diguanylate cyclase [Halomonas sp. 1513]
MNDEFPPLEAKRVIHEWNTAHAPPPQTPDAIAEWHRSLVVNHPDGICEFDLQGRLQRCNPAWQRLTGHPEATLVGQHFNAFIDPVCRALTLETFDAACRGHPATFEAQITHARGHACQIEITHIPVTLGSEIVGIYALCRDITEQKRQTDDLRLLKRGVDASPSGIIMADARDASMPVVFANPAFTTITGYSQDEIIGSNCRFLQAAETDPAAVEAIRVAIREQREICVTLLNHRKDGTPFWNQLEISPVFDDGGVCTNFIGIQQDITKNKDQEARIAYQASHDLLTGLPNRSAFTDLLESAFQRSQRPTLPLALMYLDLDGFKAINDGLGHPIGNQVLAIVASRLETLVGTGNAVARLEGDEFAVLLENHPGLTQVARVAERILKGLAHPVEIDEHLIQLSASIGIACDCAALTHSHELIQRADLALDLAKHQGRNTWQWYRGQRTEHSRASVMMRHDLHAALHEGQFEVHYQPLVDALSGRICSLEALVRWQHPTRGLISPGDFIPLAESTGQIIPLGRWVLHQVCREIAEMHASTGSRLPVAVNISSLQFWRDGFLDDIKDALARSGLPPECLELEVTESVLLDGAEPVIALMETLKSMGVRVALDDFGTGFSSLSYLRDLPTHKLKIDRSFVQKAQQDKSTAAIVQGMITMAHHMDMAVVAEGIETQAQQQDMIRRHCDLLQGFLFSRPLPLAELIALPERLPADE